VGPAAPWTQQTRYRSPPQSGGARPLGAPGTTLTHRPRLAVRNQLTAIRRPATAGLVMRGKRLRPAFELGVFVEVPLIVLGYMAWSAGNGDWFYDFTIFRAAGDAVLHGVSPYVAPTAALLSQNDKFVYPTPYAFLFVPFTFVSLLVARLIFLALSVVGLAISLWMLGVRDRRCLAVAFFGAPVFVALAMGTISPLLLVLVAAGWRYRQHTISGVLFAVAAAAKLFLWPLLIWLVLTRRLRASVASFITLVLISLLWALTDLDGLRHYPTTVRVLNDVQRWKSYSPQSLAISLHLGARAGEITTAVIAVTGIGLMVWLARRPDGDRRTFSAGIALALLTTPILWSHYLVLLLVPIALLRPRLSRLWLLPVALWVTPGTDVIGSSWRIAAVLSAIVFVAVVSCRERRIEPDVVDLEVESPARSLRARPWLA
jgi:hypothetical protein